MAPHLNVSAGPTVESLQTLYVNGDLEPTVISTDKFRGRVTVRIKHFSGDTPEGKDRIPEAKYFESGLGKGMTWSIQIQGRFLKKVSTDDLVFGNQFEHPIRDKLPYGTSVALQAAKWIDPNLEQDIYSDEPWAFSPLIATMNRISVDKLPSEPKSSNAEEEFSSEGWPVFPSPESKPSGSQQKREFVHDDVSALIPLDDAQIEMDYATLESLKSSPDSGAEAGQAHKARANWFGKKKNRQTVWFGPQDVVSADFCNAFIDFNTLRLELPYTGGMGFELAKYWDGQPVRYFCKDKSDGTIFFVIQFLIKGVSPK